MRKLIGTMVILVLCATIGVVPTQARESIDSNCYVEASRSSNVSLGFPVASERLNSRPNPRILVIPFRLSDTPNFQFTQTSKEPFALATEQISRLSSGKSKVRFEFEDLIDIPYTTAQLIQLRDNQHNSYRRDESSSTFGFVRWFISFVDDQIDFNDFDAVYLQGSSNIGATSIAEAMMFEKDSADPWFRPVETKEGPILNVVLTDAPKTQFVVTHEVLHLYGLTDLYGSSSSPSALSIMSGHPDGLLLFEKWVLGWLPDSHVTCTNYSSQPVDPKILDIPFPRDGKERVHVVKLTQTGTALIVEFSRKPYGSSFFEGLAVYSLNNESRPPIALHSSRNSSPGDATVLSIRGEPVYDSIASQFWGSGLSLLIHDITPESVLLKLIPSSVEASKVVEDARKQQKLRMAAPEPETQGARQVGVAKCVKGTKERKPLKNGKCPKGFKKK